MGTRAQFVKNTVSGKRRGSKWPPQVQVACLSEMVIKNNLHAIAQKHGVPESTLRGWWNKLLAQGVAQQAEVVREAQKEAVREIAFDATMAAKRNMGLIATRLEQAERNEARCEEIDGALLEGVEDEETAKRMQLEKMLRPPMGDYPLANYARVLMMVQEKATAPTEDKAGGGALSEGDRQLLENVAARRQEGE